jgi:hypothetical protein
LDNISFTQFRVCKNSRVCVCRGAVVHGAWCHGAHAAHNSVAFISLAVSAKAESSGASNLFAKSGGGLSVDRSPPLTHVLGRLLFYSIHQRKREHEPCFCQYNAFNPIPVKFSLPLTLPSSQVGLLITLPSSRVGLQPSFQVRPSLNPPFRCQGVTLAGILGAGRPDWKVGKVRNASFGMCARLPTQQLQVEAHLDALVVFSLWNKQDPTA